MFRRPQYNHFLHTGQHKTSTRLSHGSGLLLLEPCHGPCQHTSEQHAQGRERFKQKVQTANSGQYLTSDGWAQLPPRPPQSQCWVGEKPTSQNKIKIQEGYIEKPKTYGLGVKFDEKIIEQFPYKEKINTMISTSDTDIQLV